MLQGSLSSGDFREVNDGEAVFSEEVGGPGGRASWVGAERAGLL